MEEETLVENHADRVECAEPIIVEPDGMVAVEARHNGVVHLNDTMYGVRGDVVERSWAVEARGRAPAYADS